jgi:hypothetical protein
MHVSLMCFSVFCGNSFNIKCVTGSVDKKLKTADRFLEEIRYLKDKVLNSNTVYFVPGFA